MGTTPDFQNLQMDIEACWLKKMDEFENRLQAAATHPSPTLAQLSDDFQSFKSVVSNMLNLLRQQVEYCYSTIDSLDMQKRRKILLFYGIPEVQDTNTELEVLKIINVNFGLPQVTSAFFKRCHRLGVQTGDKPRPILVHFKEHCIKSEIWKSKSKLKGSSVTVSEFLTKARQLTFKRARHLCGMKNVWTFDGVIHIKLPDGGRGKITGIDGLNKLLAKFPSLSSAKTTFPSDEVTSIPQTQSPSKTFHQPPRRHAIGDTDNRIKSRRAASKK